MTKEEHMELLKAAVLGYEPAFDFIVKLVSVCRVWDNAWDGDRPCTKEDVNNAFTTLLFDLEQNAFYRVNRDVLNAQIFISWNAWSDANIWCDSDNKYKRCAAFYIKNYCDEIVHLCSFMVGGKDHARSFSLKLREAHLEQEDEGLL